MYEVRLGNNSDMKVLKSFEDGSEANCFVFELIATKYQAYEIYICNTETGAVITAESLLCMLQEED